MFFRKIITRPNFMEIPAIPQPVHVRSVGHYSLDRHYQSHSSGNDGFVEIIWGIKGHGEISINDDTFILNPGDVVWKGTADSHAYNSLSSIWELRWFTFDGNLADMFIGGYQYPRHSVSAGNCPVEYFREIERGLKTMTPYEQRRLISVACNILAMMGRKHDGRGESDLTSERFISLVHNHYMDVNININIIADMMGMHRTTLNRHFRQSMHYSPKDYLKQVRVQRAMTLLEEGKLTVAEIAVKVGMPNASHFARAIKKNTGKTPQGLRTISEG